MQLKLCLLVIVCYNSVDKHTSLILLDCQRHGKDSTVNTLVTLTYAPEADAFSCSSYPFARGYSSIQRCFLLNFESARVYKQAYECKLYFMAVHVNVQCNEV